MTAQVAPTPHILEWWLVKTPGQVELQVVWIEQMTGAAVQLSLIDAPQRKTWYARNDVEFVERAYPKYPPDGPE